MKKLFLTLVLAVGISQMSLYAQSQTEIQTTGKKPKYVYCELLTSPRPFSTKVNIIVDYGQETKFFQDTRLRDEESGNLKKFNSIVDAMNYMADHGWEYIDAYVVPTGNGSAFVNNTHWVLRKIQE